MSTQISVEGFSQKDGAKIEQKISLDKLVRRTSSVPGVGAEGVKHPKHEDLWREGYNFARESKAIQENDTHVQVLRARAKSAAGELQLGPFDPENNPADKETLEKQHLLKEDRTEVKAQIRRSEGDLLDVQKAAVESPAPASSRPEEPSVLIILCTAFLAIPLMPTAFDFWRLNDPVLNWATAILISLFIGLPVAKVLFYVPSAKSNETSHVILAGLLIATGVAIGFGAIRIALGGSYWMAGGLTLLELFIILAIELVARRYRRSVQQWDSQEQAHRQAVNLVELQSSRVNELHDRLDSVRINLESIEEELQIRHLLATQPEKVEQSFMGSISAGYSHGIAANKADYEAHVIR